MPIIICPECGGKVSTTLDSCPHCGFKISNELKGNAQNPQPVEQQFKCLINIKREHRVTGKVVSWYLYNNDKQIAILENGQVYTVVANKPGNYKFIVYHKFNSPTTKPIEKANVIPAQIDLEVLPTDHTIDIVVDLNSGVFKASLVVKSIDRH